MSGQKIAESYSSSAEVKNEVENLLTNLHKEDSANIIIFISHHTKEKWILDEIQISLLDLFDKQKAASLSRESLSFMQEFIESIPDLVLEKREVREERRRRDSEIDAIERSNTDDEANLEPNDILAKINKTFKGIEIIGQIVRNRHASLNKQTLIEMTQEATETGLRFLQYFIEISDVSREEVIKTIEHVLLERPNAHHREIEKEAKNTFLLLTYGVIYGVLRKISTSIGSTEAIEIYRHLESTNDSPAIKLLIQTIELQFTKQLDIKRLNTLAKEFESNPTCLRMLKEIIIQHTYMFPVGYRDMQRISESLNIPVRGQRIISQQKKTKF